MLEMSCGLVAPHGARRHGASLGGLPTSSILRLANVQARTGDCAGMNVKAVPRAATM